MVVVLVSKERTEKLLPRGTMEACNENKSKLVEWTAGRVQMINLAGNVPSNLGCIDYLNKADIVRDWRIHRQNIEGLKAEKWSLPLSLRALNIGKELRLSELRAIGAS